MTLFRLLSGADVLLYVHFSKAVHAYRQKIDNCFSDAEEKWLQWVRYAFFSAFALGILALIHALFISTVIALLFSVLMFGFYFVFGFLFVRYAFLFPSIEEAIRPEACAGPFVMSAAVMAELDEKVSGWIDEKGFTEVRISVTRLASQLYTNRNYLSEYIKKEKAQSFRDWINCLRIAEAQKLILQHPEMKINEIALKVGFVMQSHFSRLFLKQTGSRPQSWRKGQM